MNQTNDEKLTIYFCSNHAETTHKWTLTNSRIRALFVGAAILTVVVLSAVFDYVGLVLQKEEHARVKTEYQFLLSNLQFIEGELNSLESQLEQVKELTGKIEVIQEYYSRGPTATMSTPTEYFTVDYVATDEGRRPSALNEEAHKALLTKESTAMAQPLIHRVVPEEDFVINKMSNRIELAVANTLVTEKKVMQLWENLSERQNFIRATPSIKPAPGWFSSRFGIRADPFTGRPTMHSGLDIAARYGAPVYSAADGIVSFVGYQNGYGNIVAIDHGYGIQTRYAHNSKVHVKVGDQVRRFDRVASIGNSGRSTGAHLHYEVRVRGVAVDPINYILDF